jgi:hypothetical protein
MQKHDGGDKEKPLARCSAIDTKTNRSPQQQDWASGVSSLLIWGLPALGLYVTAEAGGLYRDIGWPVLLAFMGVACALNARRCSRIHCYVTGPFLLVLASVALLLALGIVSLGRDSWDRLTMSLVIGGLVFTFIPELVLGRYRSSKAQNR